MEKYIKESIRDEEENRLKYPTKTIVFTSLIIVGILLFFAFAAILFHNFWEK